MCSDERQVAASQKCVSVTVIARSDQCLTGAVYLGHEARACRCYDVCLLCRVMFHPFLMISILTKRELRNLNHTVYCSIGSGIRSVLVGKRVSKKEVSP